MNDAVGAQEAKLTTDLGRALAVRRGGPTWRRKQASKVAVAETRGREFTTRDDCQESEVSRIANAQCADAPAVVVDRVRDPVAGDRAYHIAERGCALVRAAETTAAHLQREALSGNSAHKLDIHVPLSGGIRAKRDLRLRRL